MTDEEAHMRDLTAAICNLFHERKVSRVEGVAAMIAVIVAACIEDGVSKERAVRIFSEGWDMIAKKPRGEDFSLEIMPGAQAMLDREPELEIAMRDVVARIRGALDGVRTGRFRNLDEAMHSIGAEFVLADDDEDDDDDD